MKESVHSLNWQMWCFADIYQTTILVVTKKTRICENNQEANYAHPLRDVTCMGTPVTRWELHMTIGYCVSFLMLLCTSKIKHDPCTLKVNIIDM